MLRRPKRTAFLLISFLFGCLSIATLSKAASLGGTCKSWMTITMQDNTERECNLFVTERKWKRYPSKGRCTVCHPDDWIPNTNTASYAGTWKCPIRGTLTLQQASNGHITGSFRGAAGQHWHKSLTGGGTVSGSVTGKSFAITMNNLKSRTTTNANAQLSANGKSFSGNWDWIQGGRIKDSGSWRCNR